MTPQRWQQIKDVLHDALDHEPSARRQFLSQECRDDTELRREVESFLATESDVWDFLDSPIFSLHTHTSRNENGKRIGAYELGREIGSGGMGRVFLANRTDDFEKKVAIKLLHPGMGSDDIIRRFRRERQTLAQLEHPNIVRLLDGGTTDEDLPYFVVEYIEGEPITHYCDRHRLSIAARLRLFQQVCDAVQTAHRSLIVHRDLKPANILVTNDGIPKLLDFGIAKILRAGSTTAEGPITNLIQRPGTPGYISPEQVQGQPITTASDVYGLGVLLYELLSGRPPYPELIYGSLETLQMAAKKDPKPPSTVVRDHLEISRSDAEPIRIDATACAHHRGLEPPRLWRQLRGDLDAIVLQAMQRRPDERYASVEQLGDDVERYLGGFPIEARQASTAYHARRFLRRNWIGTTVVGVVFSLLVAFGLRELALRQAADTERLKAVQVRDFLEVVLTATDPNLVKGDEVTALDFLRAGVETIRNNDALEPETRGDLLEIMGLAFRKLGGYENALPLIAESIEVRKKGLGERHPDAGNGLLALGGILNDQRKLTESEAAFREAISIYEEARLTDSVPRVASALQGLAIVLARREQLDEAIGLYGRALEGYEQAKSPDSEAITTARSNLASALIRQGRNREAEPLLLHVIGARKAKFGSQHLTVAIAHNKLALLHRNIADMPKALHHAQASYDIRDLLYEDDHDKFIRGVNTMGIVLHDSGRIEEAITFFRRAERGYLDRFGEQSPPLAGVRIGLASALTDLGSFDEARALLAKAITVHRRTYPDGHRYLAGALRHSARVEALIGVPAQALALAEQSVAMFTQSQQPDDWRLADARSVLGECLARMGRREEAFPILQGSLETLAATRGPDARRTKEARERNRIFLDEALPPRVVFPPGGDG